MSESEIPTTSPANEAVPTAPTAPTVPTIPTAESKHWSDRKADTVGVLVIVAALVLAAVHFISGGLSS